MKRSTAFFSAWFCAAMTACGVAPSTADGGDSAANTNDAASEVSTDPEQVVVRTVMVATMPAELGTVQALAENGDDVFVFGSRGLLRLAGGAVASTDATVRDWRVAAVVPAGDRSGASWVLAADAMGKLYRVRDRSVIEDVTARYALTERRVRSIAALNATSVAFGLEGGFAIADGMRVQRWDVPGFEELVAGGGKIAVRTASGVRVFDPAMNRFVDYAITDVLGVALDAMGKLYVTTRAGGLLLENEQNALTLVWQAAAALRSPVFAGRRIWIPANMSLSLWDASLQQLRLASMGTVPNGATIVGSPSGDVWVVANGMLARYGVSVSPLQQQWEEQIQPIFATRCTPCHQRGGAANIDLSGFQQWVNRASGIRNAAVTMRTMPPPPNMTTDAERAAITAWLNALEAPPDAGADAGSTDATTDATAMDVIAADVRPDVVAMDVRPDVPAMDVRPDVPAMDARPDVVAMDVRTDTMTMDVRPDAMAMDVAREADVTSSDAGPVTFAQVFPIVQRSCATASCHGAATPSGGLLLTPEATAFMNLVNTAARGCTTPNVRVVPGQPMQSLLYVKLLPSPSCGVQMPRGAAALPAAELELVRSWIAGGAMR